MGVAPSPKPDSAGPPIVALAWPRSAQIATAFFLGAISASLTVYLFSYSRWGCRPTEWTGVDLNRADGAELVQIPGIGNALATKIEAHRRHVGRFRSIDDLAGVEGIGPVGLQRLRQQFYVSESGESLAPSRVSVSGKYATKILDAQAPIELNRASATDLQRLPGIGVKLAERIVEERQRRRFISVSDLLRVRGIGPKTLEKLRPYVVVTPDGELAAGHTP
jgi:competence protein ComEA